MPKNSKNMLILGVLFLVIILVYGKNLFKKKEVTPESLPEFEQTSEGNSGEILSETTEKNSKGREGPLRWGRDPFVADEILTAKLEMINRPRKLFLSGIAYKEGVYLAVIDGKVVKKGDIIENKKIINISEDRIILQENDKFEVLKVREE